MKVADVMSIGVVSISPDDTIQVAARRMLANEVGALSVVDEDGLLQGIVTERDLLTRREPDADQPRPRWLELLLRTEPLSDAFTQARQRQVADVMSRDVATVQPETHLSEAVGYMDRRGYGQLPVVRDGEVIGIVNRANLLSALSAEPDRPPYREGDVATRQRVLDAIRQGELHLNARIEMAIVDGVVTLNGHAASDVPLDRLIAIIESVPDVSEVRSHVQVPEPELACS
ncbi:CBS domain-containing protein [Amorphus sp. 3PC139-8]|uniref:CBS domain-containing protein n=1 Tax=Amorphus sp. 3PC139-8 TaxID=2735676 RepID=UPI00345D2042